MVTIKEVAKACGVSVATVSNIINQKPGTSDKTREKVLDMIEKMQYTPNVLAKNLKMQKTRSIGVIVEDMTIFSIPDIVDGITEHCEEVEYQILLTNLRLFKKYNDTYYDRDDYYDLVRDEMRKLREKQVEGIIYVAAHERAIPVVEEDFKFPLVMAYGYSENDHVPSVVVDDTKGAYEIVSYLIACGHKKIGLITGKKYSFHTQARLLGYQKALYDEKILYDPELVCTGDWTRESGYQYVDYLLEKGVTALFCMNDLMAGGVYDRMDELHMEIGKEMSVVGYDNRELSNYYKPPLTTMTLPLHDIGYRASEIMIEMLEGKTIKKEELVSSVECKMNIRKSVQDLKNDTKEL